METILLKIGGSIITDKTKEIPLFLKEKVKQIIKQLPKKNIIIIHGAGSFGHPLAKKYNLSNGLKQETQKIPIAKTQNQVNQLNNLICQILIEENIPAYPFLANWIMKNKEIHNANTQPILEILKKGLVPVLYGSMAPDLELGTSVLSGDDILLTLAKEIPNSKVIFTTDVEGVYDKDPQTKDAKLLKKVTKETKLILSESKGIDVTKGMLGKVNKILASKIKAQIINGKNPENIKKTINKDENIGTLVLPS